MIINCYGSSSEGNAYRVEFEDGTRIFLDAGINPRSAAARSAGYSGNLVLITHEHGDHTKHIKSIQRKYSGIIAATPATLEHLIDRGSITAWGTKEIEHETRNKHRNLIIEAIPVTHNAIDPVGYWIRNEDTQEALIYITDAGHPPEISRDQRRVHAAIIEANYTDEKIKESAQDPRAYHMARTVSGFGHLSAREAGQIVDTLSGACETVLLHHISPRTFDSAEYFNDPKISQRLKDTAMPAKIGVNYNTQIPSNHRKELRKWQESKARAY